MGARVEASRPALAGVRILDFSSLLAGPISPLFVGMLGAEVIKVESRVRLEGMRRPPYAYDDPEDSPVYNSLNLNKMCVQLNLKEPAALELALRLVSISDAVVENMRPGVMERMGLGYDRLRRVNPSIVMVSGSSAGSAGPESSYPGYANVFNSLSGLGHLTGYPDAPPSELRDSIDARVGATSAFAVLTGLFHRRRTGEGGLIDLSASEALTMFGGEALMEYAMNGRVQHRQGNREPGMAPHGCYQAKGDDAWLTIAVGNDTEWQALCRATGRGDWASDPRFSDRLLRCRNQEALDEAVQGWTAKHTSEEAARILQSAGVAAAPSMSSRDLAEDPHLMAREVWREVEHPVLGAQIVQGPPWKLSETPPTVRSAGPLLGQHNHHVFVEMLGMSPEAVARWQEAGVIN